MLTAVILLIICSTADSVRLADGSGPCSGRVEVNFDQSWTKVCETDFDLQDAEVVCRELGCGTPLTLQGSLFGEGEHPFGNKEFQCKGTETSLLSCSISAKENNICAYRGAVELTCSGVKPSITFTSPTPIYTYLPKKHNVEIYRDFNITCSIEPQFTGGLFKLKVPWTDEIFTQKADNHSASYLCPYAEKEYHEGNYSCIYENDVFTSESETHTVYLQDLEDVSLVNGIVKMFHSGQWWTVSAMGMNESDSLKHAAVVCRQLRYRSVFSATKVKADEKTMQFLSNCSGSERLLRQCNLVHEHQTNFIDSVKCKRRRYGASEDSLLPGSRRRPKILMG